MGDLEALREKAREMGRELIQKISDGKSLIIIGNSDVDGICSVSLLAKAIQRKNGKPIIRIMQDINEKVLTQLKESGYDLCILCGLGSNMVAVLEKSLDGNWIMVDHNQLASDELTHSNIFNTNQFGYDGSLDGCTTTMAYNLALAMDNENIDLAWISVLASLASGNDQGERRSLLALNKIALDDAVSTKSINLSLDLLFFGRTTRPMHEAIASTINPYILNLSGNRDASMATLVSSGISVKDNDRWKTIADLDEDEKKKLVDEIIPYLTPSENADEALDKIIGNIYTLLREDDHSPLSDAREFGSLLDSCARMKSPSLGISICLGDRDQALQEAERLLVSYKQTLNKYIRLLLSDDERFIESSRSFLLSGDGLVDESMLSLVVSILSNLSRFQGKVIILKTGTNDGDAIFCGRKTIGCDESINLGKIMLDSSKECKGRGWGTKAVATALVSMSKSESFLKTVNGRLG